MDEFTSRNKQILEERAAKRQEARRLSAQKRKKKFKSFLVFFIIFDCMNNVVQNCRCCQSINYDKYVI